MKLRECWRLIVRTARPLYVGAAKGISSVQLAKELGVAQNTAWFLEHRISEAMKSRGGLLGDTVKVDETYVGGKRANKSNAKRKELEGTGRPASRPWSA